MNIKELEEKLQIPRANIRYYEREGLIHPQRGENNYRAYTDEDIAALEKIRLLRQLDMPVDTIRSVQQGEVTLAEALTRQSDLLSSEAARLDHSRLICRAMLSDGVTYPELNAAKYRAPILPGSQRPVPPPPRRPPVEGAVWATSPWQRWWARSFDFAVIGCFLTLLFSFVFRISSYNTNRNLMDLLITALSWLLMAGLEPLLLSTWGTTPGKWLLGLELRNEDGKKLGFSDALWRLGGVFSHVCGFGIPGYEIYRHYKCYQACKDGEEMPYDENEGHLYYSLPGERWFWRAVASIALTALLFVPAEVFATFHVVTPPHRGEITAPEYYENVNYMAKQLDVSIQLDENGVPHSTAFNTIVLFAGDPPVHVVETDSSGHVTAVTLKDASTQQMISLPFSHVHLAIAALQGAHMNGFQLLRSSLWQETSDAAFAETLFRDGAVTLRGNGYTLTATLKHRGYISIVDGILFAPDGLTDVGHTFTVRLTKDR